MYMRPLTHALYQLSEKLQEKKRMKKENLKEIDQTIRKILTMYGGLHRRSNVDWLYITR